MRPRRRRSLRRCRRYTATTLATRLCGWKSRRHPSGAFGSAMMQSWRCLCRVTTLRCRHLRPCCTRRGLATARVRWSTSCSSSTRAPRRDICTRMVSRLSTAQRSATCLPALAAGGVCVGRAAATGAHRCRGGGGGRCGGGGGGGGGGGVCRCFCAGLLRLPGSVPQSSRAARGVRAGRPSVEGVCDERPALPPSKVGARRDDAGARRERDVHGAGEPERARLPGASLACA